MNLDSGASRSGRETVEEPSLLEQFHRTTRLYPHALAVTDGGVTLTYDELRRRVESVARGLARRGVQLETRVAVCVERSVDAVVLLLSILEAGAAYVPLDARFPAERVAFMVNDAKVSLVVGHRHLLSALPELGVPKGGVEEVEAATGVGDVAPFGREAHPDNLAYVMYTSGSTGMPKGVLVTRRGLSNLVLDMATRLGVTEADGVLHMTSLSFDISGLELYVPLVVGARSVVVPSGMSPVAAGRHLAEWGVTVVQATPSVWRLLLHDGPETRHLCMLSGGEALPSDLAGELVARGGALWNVYGPTETTIWSSAVRIHDPSSITLGVPVARTSLHVLDEEGRPVAVGETGELCIGGAGVARGYMGRAALTAEKFVPDPFAGEGARLYRTGDLVRRLEGDELEFVGRRDTQVKIHGHRIELGEIDVSLRRCAGITDSATTVRQSASGEPRLVSYVMTKGAAPNASELRRELGTRLPDYMVPSAFVRLDALPLLPSGKLDMKRCRHHPKKVPVENTSHPEGLLSPC